MSPPLYAERPARSRSARLLERVVRELGRLREDAGRLDGRGERRRALAGAGERLPRLPLDLGCVVGIGEQPVGIEVVRGDDLDDLLLVRPRGREMPRRGEVARLALAPWRASRRRRA